MPDSVRNHLILGLNTPGSKVGVDEVYVDLNGCIRVSRPYLLSGKLLLTKASSPEPSGGVFYYSEDKTYKRFTKSKARGRFYMDEYKGPMYAVPAPSKFNPANVETKFGYTSWGSVQPVGKTGTIAELESYIKLWYSAQGIHLDDTYKLQIGFHNRGELILTNGSTCLRMNSAATLDGTRILDKHFSLRPLKFNALCTMNREGSSAGLQGMVNLQWVLDTMDKNFDKLCDPYAWQDDNTYSYRAGRSVPSKTILLKGDVKCHSS
jgi:hypothetical protein